ncbi:origin recognition complex subunit 4 [Anaeramoeba flamelloides]|uniref:Origin recognition complex subunit 4 n=1 Tax=Anaeramoeba flamelloides TaxID=1746091 RepID=A0ABQ8XD07_9EUKA|nr:origin recognition complex subunit 4 [Anaeramoeba flamelloides]
MEKRVKSRFSQRVITCFGITKEKDLIKALKERFNIPKSKFEQRHYQNIENFNNRVQVLLDGKSFRDVIQEYFYCSRNFRNFLSLGISASSKLNKNNRFLTIGMFPTVNYVPRTSKLLLNSISDLELTLLICYQKLERAETYPINFNLIFNEYRKFTEKKKSGFVSINYYKKDICFRCFEHLLDLELLIPTSKTKKIFKNVKHFIPVKIGINVHDITSMVDNCSILLKHWLNQ